jgi:hypothetical protein
MFSDEIGCVQGGIAVDEMVSEEKVKLRDTGLPKSCCGHMAPEFQDPDSQLSTWKPSSSGRRRSRSSTDTVNQTMTGLEGLAVACSPCLNRGGAQGSPLTADGGPREVLLEDNCLGPAGVLTLRQCLLLQGAVALGE